MDTNTEIENSFISAIGLCCNFHYHLSVLAV